MFCLLEVAIQTRETHLGPDYQKNERKRMCIRAYGQLSYGLLPLQKLEELSNGKKIEVKGVLFFIFFKGARYLVDAFSFSNPLLGSP